MLYFLDFEGKMLILEVKSYGEFMLTKTKNFTVLAFANIHITEAAKKWHLKQYRFENSAYSFTLGDYGFVLDLEKSSFWHNENSTSSDKARNILQTEIARMNDQLKTIEKDNYIYLHPRSSYPKQELEAHTLIDFLSIIDELSMILKTNTESDIVPKGFYRGQSDSSWGLLPYLFRKKKRLGRNEFSGWKPLYEAILVTFQKRVHPYVSDKSLPNRDLLALGQHNGLPTNLLDWTTNPLIALYFACKGRRKKPESRGGAVWIASYELSLDSTKDSFFRPSVVSPFIEAQQGWFSEHPLPENDKPFVPIDEISIPSTWDALVKIVIPEEVKNRILAQLQQAGVDESSVFPSLGGIARAIGKELPDIE